MGFIGCKEGAELIKIAIRDCSKFKEWPIRMDKKTRRVYLDQSWKTKVRWSIQCCLLSFLLAFIISRLIVTLKSDDIVDTSQVIFILLFIVLILIPISGNAIFFFNGFHVASVINLAVPYFEAYEGSNSEGKQSKNTRAFGVLRINRYTLLANGVLFFFVLVARLDAEESILIALGPLGQIWPVRLVVVLWYAFMCRSAGVLSAFLLVHAFVIPLWTIGTLQDLRKRVNSSDCTAKTLQETLKAYRQLCIITREFNKSIAIYLPSLKQCTIVPGIFATYAIVKMGGFVALFCAVYAADTIVHIEGLLNTLADVHCESEAYLKCVRQRVGRKQILGKEIKAAGCAAIEVGGQMYFVDKGLMLTVLHIIVTNAVSLMLAT